MRKLFLYLLLFFTQAWLAQDVLSLELVLKTVLEKNHQVQISRNEWQADKLQNNPGSAGMSPTVSLNSGLSMSNLNSYQEFSSGTTQERTGAASTNLNAAVNASWMVFDGLKMFAVKKRLNETENLSATQLKQQMEITLHEAILAYYDIVRIGRLIRAQKQNLLVYEERKKIEETRLSIGTASKVELMLIRAEENKAKSELYLLEQELSNAKVTLNRQMNRAVDIDFITADTILINSAPDLEALRSAYKKNTSFLVSRHQEAMSTYLMKEARSAYLPFVQVNGAYSFTRFQSEAGFLFLNKQNGLSAGLTAGWVIFNGGKNNKLVKERQINLLNEQIRTEQVKSEIDASVYLGYRAFQTGQKIFELEKQNLIDAEELLKVAMERYKIGKSAYIEMKEAQTNYESAQTRCINALYQLKKAETDLLQLTGELVK